MRNLTLVISAMSGITALGCFTCIWTEDPSRQWIWFSSAMTQVALTFSTYLNYRLMKPEPTKT